MVPEAFAIVMAPTDTSRCVALTLWFNCHQLGVEGLTILVILETKLAVLFCSSHLV
jgi:hypothetical protein